MAVPLSRPTFVLACLRLRERLRVELAHRADLPPHRLGVLGIARVQDAQVSGHHAAVRWAGAVVDDRLQDLYVQAGLVRSAAQDVGEVSACQAWSWRVTW